MQVKLAVLKEYSKMYLAIGFQETFKKIKQYSFRARSGAEDSSSSTRETSEEDN